MHTLCCDHGYFFIEAKLSLSGFYASVPSAHTPHYLLFCHMPQMALIR